MKPIMYNEKRGVSMMDIKLQQTQMLKPQLTQELKQAITLLGYNSAELAGYIDELSLENPLIERKETDTPPLSYHGKIVAACLFPFVQSEGFPVRAHQYIRPVPRNCIRVM